MTDGGTGRVVSVVDGQVHRPRHPWTPTVHAVLTHLHESGLGSAPEPRSLNDAIEVVSYLPGAAGADCWPFQATEDGLRSAARLLRRVHDATDGWPLPSPAIWGADPVPPHEVICHGDPGPWNMVWRDGEAVGLFDWDFCHPGPRIEDVAYALEYLAPFRDDTTAVRWHGFDAPPDRARRIDVFCSAYGIAADGMVDAVIEVQRRGLTRVEKLARAGIQPQAGWVAAGHLDELAARLAWTQDHRELFT